MTPSYTSSRCSQRLIERMRVNALCHQRDCTAIHHSHVVYEAQPNRRKRSKPQKCQPSPTVVGLRPACGSDAQPSTSYYRLVEQRPAEQTARMLNSRSFNVAVDRVRKFGRDETQKTGQMMFKCDAYA